MHFLFADETNTSPNQEKGIKFFVYGGLIVPSDQIPLIDSEIRKIRSDAGYLSSNSLKFDSRSRPDFISVQEFGIIKNKVVEIALKSKCLSSTINCNTSLS